MALMERGPAEMSLDYRRIERAIHFLDAHALDQPSLENVADAIGLSPFHAQRLFTRWAGLSPKRFLGLLTVGHAKAALQAGESVLDATLEVGLSGPSRLHDLFVTYEAMTPGEYRQQAADLEIRYGFHPTPFGEALLLATERGIAGLRFVDAERESALDLLATERGVPGLRFVGAEREGALKEAHEAWPKSHLVQDQARTGAMIERLFDRSDGARPHLVLKGTNFQVKVWTALLRVPPGRVVSYLDLASAIGEPRSVRAVGTALSRNPIGFVVPCHRVIRRPARSATTAGARHAGARSSPGRRRTQWPRPAERVAVGRGPGSHRASFPVLTLARSISRLPASLIEVPVRIT